MIARRFERLRSVINHSHKRRSGRCGNSRAWSHHYVYDSFHCYRKFGVRLFRRLRTSFQLTVLRQGFDLPVRPLRERQHGRDERAIPEQQLRSARLGWARFRVASCDAGTALKYLVVDCYAAATNQLAFHSPNFSRGSWHLPGLLGDVLLRARKSHDLSRRAAGVACGAGRRCDITMAASCSASGHKLGK